MKSVIEGLFASLLENSNFSDKSKKNKSDNKDDFSSDINQVFLSINEDNNKLEVKEDQDQLFRKVNTNLINKANNNTKDIKETLTDEKKLLFQINNPDNIKETSRKGNKLVSLDSKIIKNNNVAIMHNTKTNNSMLNSDKEINNTFVSNKSELSRIGISLLESKPSNSKNIKTQTKEKKIKTFFKNYLNFSNLKNSVKNKKVIKIITSNSLNTLGGEINLLVKNNNVIPKVSFKEKLSNNFSEKNNITINLNNINENTNLENSSNEKNLNHNKTTDSLLKNILDFKSNNVNQRLAEMFERNIKLGNNKFEIQIKPENLGKIEVIMEINGDNIDIAFKVDNSNVASLLSENNANLQKSLSSQGLNLNNFNLNYNSSNKFGEDNLKKEKKSNMNKNTKEEESLDLKIEKHYKDNNLVYIKA